jgi:hypothetical protein
MQYVLLQRRASLTRYLALAAFAIVWIIVMSSLPAEEKLAYVLFVLKNTGMPKPDWHAIAKEEDISNANNA